MNFTEDDDYLNRMLDQLHPCEYITEAGRLYDFAIVGTAPFPKWILAQYRHHIRESERTLRMDSVLQNEREIEIMAYIDEQLLQQAWG